jgi:hypothetical protein
MVIWECKKDPLPRWNSEADLSKGTIVKDCMSNSITTNSITDIRAVRSNSKKLPAKIRAMTEGGTAWETLGYGSKFAARKAVAYAMAVNRWTFEDACRYILSDPTLPAWDLWGSSKSEIGYSGRLKRLRRDWQNAAQYAAGRHTDADVLAVCGELRAHADLTDWRGQSGRTDRDVYMVALGFAEQAKSLTVPLAERVVSVHAGVCLKTARASLRRLCAAGFLRAVHEDHAKGEANRFTVRNDVLQDYPTYGVKSSTDSVCGVKLQLPRATLAADKFGVGIGKAALDVFLVLTGEPLTATEVSVQACVHKSTAGRHLKMLAQQGLAEHTPGGWVCGVADIADYEPDRDRVKERKALYERERARFYGEAEVKVAGPEICVECDAPGSYRIPSLGLLCNQCRDELMVFVGRDCEAA